MTVESIISEQVKQARRY